MSTIAVDAMGGDSAPEEVVKGAILAKKEGVDVILSGDENLIKSYLGNEKIPVINYPQVISMDDDPAKAIRSNKDSSIIGALNLVKEKKADAVFSAGSTGATLIGAISVLGKIKGVTRPTIASVLPGKEKEVILVDSGANLEVKPKVLYQFAIMGSKLSELLFDIENPRIGLINNGEESSKGRELEKATFKLLKSSQLNFIGNVEGKDFANSKVDVFVTDGFTGNISLKTAEGTAKLFQSHLQDAFRSSIISKMGYFLSSLAMKSVRDRLDPRVHNCGILMGLNSLAVKCHGQSEYRGVSYAADIIYSLLENNMNKKIHDFVFEMHSKLMN